MCVRNVLRCYGELLNRHELEFGHSIMRAGTDARRLLARVLGRRGPLIRIDSLEYSEVGNSTRAICDLVNLGLVDRCPDAPLEDLLALLTRKELIGRFLVEGKSRRKSELICKLVASDSISEIHDTLVGGFPWLSFRNPKILELYQLLFFGSRTTDLSIFVLRDLGIYKFESYNLDPNQRLFSDRACLDRMLRVYQCVDSARDAIEADDIESMHRISKEIGSPDPHRVIERRRSRLLNSLGKRLEQLGALDYSLVAWGQSTLPPARERCVRILHRSKREGEAEKLIETMLQAPLNQEEQEFAINFKNRTKPPHRFSICTVTLEQMPTSSIETHTSDFLTRGGGKAFHLENSLPSALFALAYWDWLFADVSGAFVNEFQASPLDLFWPDFFILRSDCADDPLESPTALGKRILANAKTKRDIACSLI